MKHINITCWQIQLHDTWKKLQEKEKLREFIDSANTPKMTGKSQYKSLKSSHYPGLKDPSSTSSVFFCLSLLQYVFGFFVLTKLLWRLVYQQRSFYSFLVCVSSLKRFKLFFQDEKNIMMADPFVPLLTEFVGKCKNRTIALLSLRCIGLFFKWTYPQYLFVPKG